MENNSDPALQKLFLVGRPLSPVYSALMRLRTSCYRAGIFKVTKLPVPVISIGNLVLGGTGKTPLVISLARYLAVHGMKPAVISRGYHGTAPGRINIVSDGREIFLDADEAGDEPRLLAESLPGIPVLTGKKRTETARYAVEMMQADAIIMDDGFQHLALARDINLVLFKATSILENYRVFPGGMLREGLTALHRADAFVITGVDRDSRITAADLQQSLRRIAPATVSYLAVSRISSKVRCLGITGRSSISIADARRLPVFCFCGLAGPAAFHQTAIQEKFSTTGFKAFRDHHRYTPHDIADLVKTAADTGAEALLTTTKDFVKLKSLPTGNLPLLALDFELTPEDAFHNFIMNRIHAILPKASS